MAKNFGHGSRNQKLPKVLWREQWDPVIAGAGGDRRYGVLAVRDAAILGLFFFSGIRCNELTGLDVKDVDLERGSVFVLGKGNKERYASFSGPAAALLEAYVDVRPDPDPGAGAPFFVSRNGGRIDNSQIRRLVKAAGRKAGLGGDMHPHRCRHSFGTRAVEVGKQSLEVLKEQLGHASLETTMIYLAVSDRRRKELVEDL